MNLKSDSAPAWDHVSVKSLKFVSPLKVPIIELIHMFITVRRVKRVPQDIHLAELFFSKGLFSGFLRQTIITPVYKIENRDKISNYRPISVLPTISKLIEKLSIIGY